MYSTQLRKDHIHGMLLGVAVGEALGLPRRGLNRRQSLNQFGTKLAFASKRGIYGEQTSLSFLYAQALLNSRNDMSNLRNAFRRRLKWYPLGLPNNISLSTLMASCKCWFAALGLESHVGISDNAAAARAIAASVLMQGAGHRLIRWVEESTKLTHRNATALDCARAIGTLAALACKPNSNERAALELLRETKAQCVERKVRDALSQLEAQLATGLSPRSVARVFGWQKGPRGCLPVTVMSVYCWLRYREDFSKALRSAVLLGGDAAVLGAVVGGLSGAANGLAAVPEHFVENLAGTPHGRKWIEQLTDRFAHWPHGVDDLFLAPAEPSRPLGQLTRNILQSLPSTWMRVRRLAAKLRI